MKASIYSKDQQHLIILPSLPRWFVVDDFGKQVFEKFFVEQKSLQEVVLEISHYPQKEIENTYHELLSLSINQENHKNLSFERSLTSRTTVAMVSVTRNCNLKCPHCYVDAHGAVAPELTLKEHKELAQQIKNVLAYESNVRYRVNLTRGEPFANPQIIDIIKAYKNQGLEISMSTNALLIKNHQIDDLENLEVRLQISLDGSSSKTHDLIRGQGAFERVINRIKALIAHGVHVGVNYLVHEGNFYDLESTVDLVYQLGCRGFNPINLVQLGRACDSPLKRVHEVEIFSRLSKHIELHPEQKNLFENTSLFSSMGAALLAGITCVSCGVGNRPCVYITSEGDVYPCPNTQCSSFRLGNIRQQSLNECVGENHPVLQHLKKINVDTLNPTCSQCDVRKFCGGDCRGETFNVTGDLYAPYVACQDRHDSIIELMWITAAKPELFEVRATEYIKNADLAANKA